MLHSICSKFGKLNSGHRTGKVQFSFQSQRKAMPSSVQITTQLHSFHMIARSRSKSFKLGFSSMELRVPCSDIQAGFRKGRGSRDQIANICWIIEKVREFPENIYFFLIDCVKALECVDHNKL